MIILFILILGSILSYAKTFKQHDVRDEFTNRFCHFLVDGNNEKDYNAFCNELLTEPRFQKDTYTNLMCKKFARDGLVEGTEQQCQDIIAKEREPKNDFYIMFSNILWSSNTRYLNPFSFLILVIPTLMGICRILKRKYIINTSTRESYKDFLIKFFKKAYRYVWVLPFIALFMIVISILGTTFDHTYSLAHFDYTNWTLSTIQNRYLFIFGYVGNILLYSCFFINLGLIVVRKYHNTFVAIIVSFLTYLGLELFFELVVRVFISLVFHSDFGHIFNIMNMWNYSDSWGLFPLLCFSITMCLLSFVGVYLSYRNKEKLVMACEKNN